MLDASAISVTTINVNLSNENQHAEEMDAQLWYFQKLSSWYRKQELRVSEYFNATKARVVFSYSALLLTTLGRVVLYAVISMTATSLSTTEENKITAEACICSAWFLYFLHLLVRRLRRERGADDRIGSFAFFLLCVHYFLMGYWVSVTVVNSCSGLLAGLNLALLLLYGVTAEKTPLIFIIFMFTLALCLAVETIARILTCTCVSSLKQHKPATIQKNFPLIVYKSAIYNQPRCGICLKDFVEDEQLLQMPCNPTHVFHTNCLKEWLSVSSVCPFCRISMSNKGV